MKSNWKRTTLGDLVRDGSADYQTGPFGTMLKASEYSDEGSPLISVGEIREGYFTIYDHTPRVCEKIKTKLPQFVLEEGDIVFGRKGAINRNAIIMKSQAGWFLGSDGIRLRLSEKHDPAFFSYFLRTKMIGQWLISNGQGAIMPSLNQKILDRLPIFLPSKAEQRRISGVLSVLDAKIELNNRINEELEGLAKLLYDYWFVQFDFPMTAAQAVALGKPKLAGQPYRASGGKMIYNKALKREIPEKWTDGSLVDVATFTNGIACQKYPADGGDTLRVIKIKDMRTGLTPDSDIVTANVPSKVKIKNGDILFSWSASLEVMIWAGGEGALNQHIFKVTSDTHPRSFCYFVLLDYLSHFRMMADLRKTTMGHITSDHLEQSQIVIPDDDVADAFEVMTKPIIDRMVKSHEENQELTQLRDWLLPMLMNGQVTVG